MRWNKSVLSSTPSCQLSLNRAVIPKSKRVSMTPGCAGAEEWRDNDSGLHDGDTSTHYRVSSSPAHDLSPLEGQIACSELDQAVDVILCWATSGRAGGKTASKLKLFRLILHKRWRGQKGDRTPLRGREIQLELHTLITLRATGVKLCVFKWNGSTVPAHKQQSVLF